MNEQILKKKKQKILTFLLNIFYIEIVYKLYLY